MPQTGLRQLRVFEPAAREFVKRLRLALRREQFDADARDVAVFVIEHDFVMLHAAVARGEEQREFAAQPAQRKQQRRPGFDAIVEFDAMIEERRRFVQREQIAFQAAHAVEQIDFLDADAAREFRARQREHVAQRAQADVVEQGDGVVGESAVRDRHVAERGDQRIGFIDEVIVAVSREHARGGGNRRDGERWFEVDLRERFADAFFEYGPAAEQTQAGADFDQQRIRFGDADLTAEFVRPRGEHVEQAFFGGDVARARLHVRADRARGRERLAGAHAGIARRRIRHDDVLPLTRSVDDGATLRLFDRRRKRRAAADRKNEDRPRAYPCEGFSHWRSGVTVNGARLRS